MQALAAPRTHRGRIATPPRDFLGHEIQRIRKSLGLSVEEVAYLADVTVWQLKHAEEGKKLPRYRPSIETFAAVTTALHGEIVRRLQRGDGVNGDRADFIVKRGVA